MGGPSLGFPGLLTLPPAHTIEIRLNVGITEPAVMILH